MFDVTLQPLRIDIEQASDEHANIVVNMGLPVSPQQAMGLGTVRIPVGKQGIDVVIQQLAEVRDNLKDPAPQSDLIVAQNLDGVQQAADMNAKFRG